MDTAHIAGLVLGTNFTPCELCWTSFLWLHQLKSTVFQQHQLLNRWCIGLWGLSLYAHEGFETLLREKDKWRFHENSSNHPQKITSLFLIEICFFGYQLAFISYKKLFECTAMHLATWKRDFQVVTLCHKYRVNHCQLTRHLHYMEA